MTALRELVFAEIGARLAAIGGVAEVERMPSGDPMDFPALHIFDSGSAPNGEGEPAITRHELPVTIEGYLEQAGGAAAHTALNGLYARVVSVMMPEPPLGGLAETIDEGALRVVVAPLASKPRLGFSLDFIITFPTRRDDPAQPA